MSLSLADELAAFDEQAMGGGGLSLADEFGLDMDMEQGQSSGLGKNLEDELNGSAPASPEPKPKRKASGLLNGSRLHAPSPSSIKHDLDERDENVRNVDGNKQTRSAKSSSSTMYGSANARSGVDETDIDASLNNTSAGDSTLGWASTSPRSPGWTRLNRSPMRTSPARGDGGSMTLDTRDAGPGFLGHTAERDPLVELHEILDANGPFLDLVTRLDEPRGAATQSSTSRDGIPTSTSSATVWDGGIETRLQRHLDRLHDDDRLREEQCRELAVLSREMGSIRWESIEMQIELEIASGRGLGLGIVDEDEEDEARDEVIGWTGESMAQAAVPHQDRGTRADTPGLDDRDRLLAPSSPLPTSIPLSPLERSPSKIEEGGALPRTSHRLVTSTPDLVATFQHLAETAHSSGSMTTSSMRHLRGIRAGVDSWRERETLEEDARRGVEAYERGRLEEGLRGEASERAAAKLQRECLEFERVLDGLERRMEQVQRETLFRKAVK